MVGSSNLKISRVRWFRLRNTSSRGPRTISTVGLAAFVTLLLLVEGGSASAPSTLPGLRTVSPAACGLLPDALPSLASAPNGEPFPVPAVPPLTYFSGNPGVPEVYPPGTSGSGAEPNMTVNNVTFGVVRFAWSEICESATFTKSFQNVSPVVNSLHQFWYDAGEQGGPSGTATVEPGFLWDAQCTGDISASTTGSPYFVRSFTTPPAYSGAGCTYWEYWSASLTSAGTTNRTGPYLLEAVTANFESPGPSTGHSGGMPGFGSDYLYLTVGAVVAIIIGVVMAVRARHSASNEVDSVPGFTR